MNEKILTAIIGAIAGLVTGGIASLIAPWIHWGIEKRKQKLQNRRDLITGWRKMISAVINFDDRSDEDGSFTFMESLLKQPEYPSFNPHLDETTLGELRRLNNSNSNGLTFTTDGRINPVDMFANRLTQKVGEIEKEWDLV